MLHGVDCDNDEIPLEYNNMCLHKRHKLPGGKTAPRLIAKVGMRFVTEF